MQDTQKEIEAHNRRELWRDVANHLRIATECIDQAQMALDDLDVPHIAENLVPTAESVEQFRALAEEKASE